MTLLINGKEEPDESKAIVSVPSEDGLKVINIFIDPLTKKITVEYDDNL